MDHRTTQAPDQSSVTPAPQFAASDYADQLHETQKLYEQSIKRIQRLLDAMNLVVNELEEDFDINHHGGPNKAMRLAQELEEAMFGPGGF